MEERAVLQNESFFLFLAINLSVIRRLLNQLARSGQRNFVQIPSLLTIRQVHLFDKQLRYLEKYVYSSETIRYFQLSFSCPLSKPASPSEFSSLFCVFDWLIATIASTATIHLNTLNIVTDIHMKRSNFPSTTTEESLSVFHINPPNSVSFVPEISQSSCNQDVFLIHSPFPFRPRVKDNLIISYGHHNNYVCEYLLSCLFFHYIHLYSDGRDQCREAENIYVHIFFSLMCVFLYWKEKGKRDFVRSRSRALNAKTWRVRFSVTRRCRVENVKALWTVVLSQRIFRDVNDELLGIFLRKLLFW